MMSLRVQWPRTISTDPHFSFSLEYALVHSFSYPRPYLKGYQHDRSSWRHITSVTNYALKTSIFSSFANLFEFHNAAHLQFRSECLHPSPLFATITSIMLCVFVSYSYYVSLWYRLCAYLSCVFQSPHRLLGRGS